MKKLFFIILILCTWNLFVFGEDSNSKNILSADNDEQTDITVAEEKYIPQETTNVVIVAEKEDFFNISAQFGYGNIFTSHSFMHGAYIGFFVQIENTDFSNLFSFQTGIRGNVYFNNSFKIGNNLYTLNTGICVNFPTTLGFKLFESEITERKMDIFIGANPEIFEIENPLFFINAIGGISYQFNNTYYITASYERSLNQKGRISETNVGLGYRF